MMCTRGMKSLLEGEFECWQNLLWPLRRGIKKKSGMLSLFLILKEIVFKLCQLNNFFRKSGISINPNISPKAKIPTIIARTNLARISWPKIHLTISNKKNIFINFLSELFCFFSLFCFLDFDFLVWSLFFVDASLPSFLEKLLISREDNFASLSICFSMEEFSRYKLRSDFSNLELSVLNLPVSECCRAGVLLNCRSLPSEWMFWSETLWECS